MLKIKDNVDLKELEKFGFTGERVKQCYTKELDFSKVCFVNKDDRKIWFGCYDICIDILDVLFDLIAAGLVEKMEV